MSEINTVRACEDEESRKAITQAENCPQEPGRNAGQSGGPPNAMDSLLEEAARIAADISSRAIPSGDDSLSWPDCAFDSATGKPRSESKGDSFFDGRCGIAFFLAAMYRATQTSRFKVTALGAIKSLSKALRSESRSSFALELPLGVGTGIGGLAYGLTRISKWLDEPRILEEACLAGETISSERVEHDEHLDVLQGSAGAILGLLSLWKATAQDRWLEQAGCCANHLLDRRESCNGHAAWRTCGASQPLTGYSHGAAGIAHALLMLFRESGETKLISAAREAIGYESSVYCADVSNWLDFRPGPDASEARRFMNAWCNGAAGIGLSRTAALGLGMDSQALRDIENAASSVMATPPSGTDTLCCGIMGQVEFLISAGFCLQQRDLVIAGLRRAIWVRRRRERRGSYQARTSVDHGVSPAFFQGESGVGYEILRLECPDEFPCVLLWD